MALFLKVNQAELAASLKLVAKFVKPRQRAEALISFEDGMLVIDIAGVAARASAEGTWPGVARVNAPFVLGLAHGVSTTSLLFFSVEETRLRVAGGSIEYAAQCVWQDNVHAIQLPVNAALTTVLGVRLLHSDDEIGRAGLTGVVRAAEERRDVLIGRAREVLQPLGIQSSDLRELVDRVLRRSLES